MVVLDVVPPQHKLYETLLSIKDNESNSFSHRRHNRVILQNEVVTKAPTAYQDLAVYCPTNMSRDAAERGLDKARDQHCAQAHWSCRLGGATARNAGSGSRAEFAIAASLSETNEAGVALESSRREKWRRPYSWC